MGSDDFNYFWRKIASAGREDESEVKLCFLILKAEVADVFEDEVEISRDIKGGLILKVEDEDLIGIFHSWVLYLGHVSRFTLKTPHLKLSAVF